MWLKQIGAVSSLQLSLVFCFLTAATFHDELLGTSIADADSHLRLSDGRQKHAINNVDNSV